jgi:RimJ/RimL family protein N-acetyltransferase
LNFAHETRTVGLRPISESDYPTLIDWRNSERWLRLLSQRRDTVSPEEFAAEIKKALATQRQAQFIIVRKRDNRAIGTIFSFNLDLTNGNVFINTFIDEENERRGYGAIATALVIRWLFDAFPIHKIYFEVFGYNKLSHDTMVSAGFKKEGRFRGARFYAGKYLPNKKDYTAGQIL